MQAQESEILPRTFVPNVCGQCANKDWPSIYGQAVAATLTLILAVIREEPEPAQTLDDIARHTAFAFSRTIGVSNLCDDCQRGLSYGASEAIARALGLKLEALEQRPMPRPWS